VKLLKHLTIGRKLALSFALVVALLVAVSGTAFWAMSSLGTAHDHVTKQVIPRVLAADAVRAAAADMHFSQTRYVLVPASHADFEADRAVYFKDLAGLKKVTGADGQAALAAVLRADARWTAIDARLWAAARAHDAKAADALVTGAANDASDNLVAALTAYQQHERKSQATADAKFASTRSSSAWIMGVLAVLAVLGAAALAFFLTRAIVRGLKQMLAAAEAIAEGDVDQSVDVTGTDEIGQMAAAFRAMIDYLRETAAAAGRVADGDLTVEVEPKSERDALGTAFAKMAASLRKLLGAVNQSVVSVSSASRRMATTSEEAGRAVDEIANAVGEVAHGAERQVAMVAASKRSGEESAEAAGQAHELAEEGVRAAAEASEAMRELRDSSQEVSEAIGQLATRSERIGEIVDTITGIAAQTNLLALNAAIEAARAGEQGRGFAVVAEEVRKLAEESQQAAAMIAGLVDEMQTETRRAVAVVEGGVTRTENGTAVVERARETFLQIGESVRVVNDRIAEIVRATDEVASVAEQSSSSTEEVSATSEETSASTQEIAASARQLAETATELEELVSHFRLAA
jgi:methyl-accepting chemotaxis protein